MTETSGDNWHLITIDGRIALDKPGVIDALASSAGFPNWAGRNWDAVEELLTDLSWLDAVGYVVYWHEPQKFAEANPKDYAIAQDILVTTAAHWADRDVPFVIADPHRSRDVINDSTPPSV